MSMNNDDKMLIRSCIEVPLFSKRWAETGLRDDEGRVVGFYCYSLNREICEGMLKFVMVDASIRGKGIGKEMTKLAVRNAFSDPDSLAVRPKQTIGKGNISKRYVQF